MVCGSFVAFPRYALPESVWSLGRPPRSHHPGAFASEMWVTFAQGVSICCFPLPALGEECRAFMHLIISSRWRLGRSSNAHLWPQALSTRAAFGPRRPVLHPHNLGRLHLHRLHIHRLNLHRLHLHRLHLHRLYLHRVYLHRLYLHRLRLHRHRLHLRHLPRTFFPPYFLFSTLLTYSQPEECWNPVSTFRSGLLGDTAPPW